MIGTALVGLLLAMTERRLRALAISMLALMLILLGIGGLIVYFDFWRGPAPVYVEMFISPVYAMFAAYAVVRLGAVLHAVTIHFWPHAARASRGLQFAGSIVAVGIIPAAAVAGWQV